MQGASRESQAELREVLQQQTDGAASADLQQVSDDLFAVVTLFASQGSLRRAVSDPATDVAAKQGLVDTLLSGKLSAPALEIVRATARARWSQPRDVVDALEAAAVETALSRAEADGQLDEVEDELFRFERIVDGEPQLRSALTDRNLPADRKRALLQRLLESKTAPVTQALIERAVLSPRGRTLERVLDEFTELAARRRSRLIARVTTAIPMSEEQQERLTAALGREFGHDVRLQLVVDPALVGGITVRVGDEVLDASVLRQLDNARRHLSGRSVGRA